MGLRLGVYESPDALGQPAADVIIAQLGANPGSALAMPTGKTPLPVYRSLVKANREGRVSFASAHVFQLDEFYPIAADHPGSFRSFLETEFVRWIDIDPGRVHSFDATAEAPQAECDRIEAQIEAVGGLDLALLGIGGNGHLAFNEPGTPFEARTHVAELDEGTRQAAAYLFFSLAEVPRRALTMGLATIMESRRIVLVAAGTRKAEAVRDALEGPQSTRTPASVLRHHPDLVVLLDREASALLSPDTLRQSSPESGCRA
ncbi:MAG: glucosamine-6-phosphate deaminase [Anaerolineae bacterium]|jgi:glucosamine-6-phosphate deaminase